MKRETLSLALAFIFLSSSSCKLNAYSQFTSGTQLRMVLEKVRGYLDAQAWDDAISTADQIYTGNEDNEEIAEVRASAYAGRAGFTYLANMPEYVNNISDGVGLPPTIVEQMIESAGVFTEATAAMESDIFTAFQTLVAIDSDPTNRSTSINMFLAFVSLAVIHIIAKRVDDSDNDEVSSLGNMCGAGVITDVRVDRMLNAIVGFFESMEQTNSGGLEPFSIILAVPRTALDRLGAGDSSATTSSTFCQTAPASNECKDQRSILDGYSTLTGGEGNSVVFRTRTSAGFGGCP